MRRIRLAAIQQDMTSPEPCLDCLQTHPSVDAIIDGYIRPRLDTTLVLLTQCADLNVDLAVTCEDITGLGCYLPADNDFFTLLTKRSEEIARESLGALASHRNIRIAGCFGIHENGATYNATLFFDTTGKVQGIYRKTHLPPNERWQFSPGQSLETFKLDIGCVSAAICYDMMFPETLAVLSQRGAEIIVHPTAGMGWYDAIGLATLRVRANDACAYLVTSKNYRYNGAGHSSIIDPWGHVRADAGFERDTVITFDADLDQRKTQPEWYWQTQMTEVADLRVRMATERRPDLYTPLTDPVDALPIPDEKRREILCERIRRGECRW